MPGIHPNHHVHGYQGFDLADASPGNEKVVSEKPGTLIRLWAAVGVGNIEIFDTNTIIGFGGSAKITIPNAVTNVAGKFIGLRVLNGIGIRSVAPGIVSGLKHTEA